MKKLILLVILSFTTSCSTCNVKIKKTNPKITIYERIYTLVVFYSIYTNPK
jgi:hypothetical protein